MGGAGLTATVGNTWRFAVRIRPIALVVSVAVLVAACGNSSTAKATTAGDKDGITPTEIHVGGLVAETGPLGDVYAHLMHGAKAYFDQVNAAGGVSGRKILITKTRDDATDTTRNTAQARALVEDDHVFAVFASSPIFPAGTYLAQKGVPTFGTNFNTEWNSGPSLFGHNGSFNDPKALGPNLAFLAQKVGTDTAGIVAYTVSSSADCATSQAAAYKKYGIKVGLLDNSLPFGSSDVTADIQRIKEAHVGLVSTCMDASGNTLVYTGLKKANLNNVKMYWPNGYDSQTLKDFGSQMEGVYFALLEVPFQDASKSPEMQRYMDQMAKSYPGEPAGEESLYGWVVASLFVKGLRMAGSNLTRSNLVNKLNTITNWTGNGLIPRVDWTKQHNGDGPSNCNAIVQVQHGQFVPVFDSPDSPFVCFARNSPDTTPIPGQKYTDVG
jgi:ABC-type branched-subunit amino acid transport system substrate-binding protein